MAHRSLTSSRCFRTPETFNLSRHRAESPDAASQQEIERRLNAAGFETMVLNHGYCVSLYVTDPNGLNLEFTVDHPEAKKIAAKRAASAQEDLRKWLAGDRSTNNEWRAEAKSASQSS